MICRRDTTRLKLGASTACTEVLTGSHYYAAAQVLARPRELGCRHRAAKSEREDNALRACTWLSVTRHLSRGGSRTGNDQHKCPVIGQGAAVMVKSARCFESRTSRPP